MIIGITGTFGAGKGAVVEYLEEKGFTHFSVRDFLRAELTRRGLSHDRDHMAEVANELRETFGSDYIMRSLYAEASAHEGNSVIESIRNIGEVTFLKQKPDFHLVAVDADRKLRYERAVLRGSSTDKISYEKFCEQEDAEASGMEPWSQNHLACMKEAEVVFHNDGTLEELKAQVDAYLDKIENQ